MAIFSKKYNFLYLHIAKTAGRSISNLLIENVEDAYSISAHATAEKAKEILGLDVYDNAFKFTFVRNPWDRAVSIYEFVRNKEDHPSYHLYKDLSFLEYLDIHNNKSKARQTDWLSFTNGKCDQYIGRFETLTADFNTIINRLELKLPKLPHENKNQRRPYREYYTNEMADSLAQSRADEISLL